MSSRIAEFVVDNDLELTEAEIAYLEDLAAHPETRHLAESLHERLRNAHDTLKSNIRVGQTQPR